MLAKEKINVAILFGGKSAEYEVSLQSAKNVFETIDKSKYNPILIAIGRDGIWRLINKKQEFLFNADNLRAINLKKTGKLLLMK